MVGVYNSDIKVKHFYNIQGRYYHTHLQLPMVAELYYLKIFRSTYFLKNKKNKKKDLKTLNTLFLLLFMHREYNSFM